MPEKASDTWKEISLCLEKAGKESSWYWLIDEFGRRFSRRYCRCQSAMLSVRSCARKNDPLRSRRSRSTTIFCFLNTNDWRGYSGSKYISVILDRRGRNHRSRISTGGCGDTCRKGRTFRDSLDTFSCSSKRRRIAASWKFWAFIRRTRCMQKRSNENGAPWRVHSEKSVVRIEGSGCQVQSGRFLLYKYHYVNSQYALILKQILLLVAFFGGFELDAAKAHDLFVASFDVLVTAGAHDN